MRDGLIASTMSSAEVLALRRRHLGGSLSLSYEEPLHVVRGEAQYLYGADGREYLDCVNNVSHVGHCHPRVVAAAARQMETLNTNTRYLHENIVRYAQRLAATLPPPLEVCFFTCSGSEANELALRMARAHTGREGVVVIDGAYHGNTNALVDVSPYKFRGPGGSGRPAHVETAATPDTYRGRYRRNDRDAGRKYAAEVRRALERARASGGAAAFFAEPILGVAGQIVPPPGFLAAAFDYAREAGAVAVADEVQVGLGRVGSHFWAFDAQGSVPDIVTMGKPLGNGHPVAAVVASRAIADSFANGMEYFNTFGGNPVSCAVGLAVLDVVEEEELQAHAHAVGAQLESGLAELQERHAVIGDVRGQGLFLGVELVASRRTLEPATELASTVVNRMKDRGILLSTDGESRNVLKLKPPLVCSAADADRPLGTLDAVLADAG